MSREEQLKFCEKCKNHGFDYQKGIICKRTNGIADFQTECEYFQEDKNINTDVNDFTITGEIRDNSVRSTRAVNIFIIIAAVNVIAVISSYFELELLERISGGGDYTDNELTFNDLRQGIVGIIQGILYICSVVLFLNWFRRAYWNMHRITFIKPEYEESMAVWSFVIPLVNLYRPYKIVREIIYSLKARLREMDSNYVSSVNISVPGYWWALFLLTNYVGQMAFRMALKDDGSLDQIMGSSLVYLISDALDIPAAIVTALMVKQIAADESLLYQKYKSAIGDIG